MWEVRDLLKILPYFKVAQRFAFYFISVILLVMLNSKTNSTL